MVQAPLVVKGPLVVKVPHMVQVPIMEQVPLVVNMWTSGFQSIYDGLKYQW